ncbi:ubiquitin-related domain-containing protein [Mariannaea sp. PMI_226]|nr:ubiquitin-related domain-containing protein [Mariannaea sp. PMI_226]
MSAPTDTTTVGGKAAPDEASPLQQPKDAVPMKSISQPSSDITPTAADTDEIVLKQDNTQPETSTAVPSKSDSTGQSSVPVSTSPKGKEKETAPPPPAKEPSDMIAIGPAVDDIKSTTSNSSDGPVCNITLLLTSGSRHPYKLDAKYLSRRNVEIPDKTENGQPDPFSISIYTLKELILREWRSDWEAKPASPSSIRLIHFGKLLDDKEPLKKYQLSTESPNVVHMSIRPQDLDEEEPKSGSKNLTSGSGDGQRQRGGGCCVVL